MSSSAPAPARRAPRIVFNSDGDIHFRGLRDACDMAGFYRGIDDLAGTQVDCYCYCISAGGDTYRHPSDVAPLLGADLEILDGVPDHLRRDIENTRALLAAGVDPLVLLPRRAREHGMEFWASMRMNDIHDDYPECAAYHGGFRKAHPELLLGSPYPEPRHRGNWRSGFCWGLDYAQPEVRTRQLVVIEEVLTRYDVDGFELDFLRGAYYFKTDERRTGMPLMTGFVRDVRALVDRAGEGKGRPLTLPGPDRRFLADARRRRAGRVGVRLRHPAGPRHRPVVQRHRGDAARGRHDLLLPGRGLHVPVQLRLPAPARVEQAVQPWRAAGAPGDRRRRGAGPAEQALHGNRGRVGERRGGSGAGAGRGHRGVADALPALLRGAGDAGVFRLWIGDDLAQAWRDDVLDAVRIRITADACRAPDDAIELAVNGTPVACDHNAWRPHGLLYTLYASRRMRGLPFAYEREDDADAAEGGAQEPPDLLRVGRNELTITLRKRRADAGPLLITGIEALINYDGGE